MFSRHVLPELLLACAGLASASINLRMSAIRKLAAEAAENGLLDRSVAQGIASSEGHPVARVSSIAPAKTELSSAILTSVLPD